MARLRKYSDHVKGFAIDFITSGMREGSDVERTRRVMMMNIISLIGVMNLIPFGIIAFFQGNLLLGCLDLIVAAGLIFIIFYLRKKKRYELVSYFGVSLAGILFIYLLLTGGPENTGHLWYYTFPLIASFLLGSKRGALATMILLIPAILLFISDGVSAPLVSYTADFEMRFIMSLLVVLGYAYTFENIREKTQKKLVEKNAELEQGLADLKDTERALRRAKEEAQAGSEAKSQFLANMSHEIRTPMNGVLGMTELLSRTELNDRQHRFLEVVKSSGEAMLNIINDILDFSKIEAGKLKLDATGFKLRQVVEDITESHAQVASEKGLELGCLIRHDVPDALLGDPGRIRQILSNLIGNAVKFTEKGEIIVVVGVAENSGDDALICFEVKDTGVGIALEEKRRIFDSFTQVDGNTTRKYGGAGLGLAISKELVEAMGGEIGVDSTPAKGCRFWFTAPLKRQRVSSPFDRMLHYDLEGVRVLTVVGNETTRRILHEYIRDLEMLPDSVGNGSEALEILRSAVQKGKPFGVVISDMMMSEMEGMKLSRAIKKDPMIADVRVIELASIGLRGDAEQARQTGISAYLTKPIRQFELYNCLVATLTGPAETAAPRFVTRYTPLEAKGQLYGQVLLAEDTLLNQEVAIAMLENIGCRVDAVADGEQAVAAVIENHYDLVFMDCQMPHMDGYEATRIIRRKESQNPESDHLPIIALTANAVKSDRERCLSAGMDDYLSKPFNQDQLQDILERWLPKAAIMGEVSGVSHDEAPAPDSGAKTQSISQHAGREKPASTQATPNPGSIDFKVLDNVRALQREGAPGLLAKLINIYLKESPKSLKSLHEAIAAGDSAAIHKTAHSFKSSSAHVGALALAALCKELEAMGRAESIEKATELFTETKAEYETVKAALTAQLKKEANDGEVYQ